jgi:hypothetical protein
MSYDQFNDPDSNKKEHGDRSYFKAGTHEVEVVEVSDFESKKTGIDTYAINCRIISSVALDNGPAPHFPGESVGAVYQHGKGAKGYNPQTRISYGDKDFKAFLVAVAQSAGLKPDDISASKSWGTLARGVISPAQTARGVRVRVKGSLRDAYEKKDPKTGAVTPAPIDPATGKVKQFLELSWHPIEGQNQFAAALMSPDAPAAATPPASAPAAPGAPTPPRPPAPPAAEHPMSDEVRKQAADWAASGQTAEAAINGLLGWAVGLGLTDAQARAAIKSQF